MKEWRGMGEGAGREKGDRGGREEDMEAKEVGEVNGEEEGSRK